MTWNCMIGGYELNERPEFCCFVQMKSEEQRVELVTTINLIAAGGSIESSMYGMVLKHT